MSLILGYANTKNAIIVSDGRAGINGCFSEHYDKTLKINNNIILGFAGFAEDIQATLDFCATKMGNNTNKYYVDDFLNLLSHIMDDPINQKHIHSSYIVIGRSEDNKMYTAIIGDSTDYKIEKNIVNSTRYLAIGGTIDGSKMFDIYRKNLSNQNMSIQDCLIKTIHDVSLLDDSVNKNTFGQII